MEKKIQSYDDSTLENLKKYYGIKNYDDLLKYIKIHGLEIRKEDDIQTVKK